MPPIEAGRLPHEYNELHDVAVQLLQQREFASAVNRLLNDDDLAIQLSEKPDAIADTLALSVPKGLDVRVVGIAKPVPDWVPFTVRLTGCRHYWVRHDGEYQRVEICRGLDIVPNPVPGGPWG